MINLYHKILIFWGEANNPVSEINPREELEQPDKIAPIITTGKLFTNFMTLEQSSEPIAFIAFNFSIFDKNSLPLH